MRRSASWLLLLLVPVACESRCGGPKESTLYEQKPQVSDVDLCVRAIDAVAEHETAGWANAQGKEEHEAQRDRQSAMALACAKLYQRKVCRSVHERLAENDKDRPAAKMAELVSACTDAYCKDLSPSPPLCSTRDKSRAPSELAPLWAELDDAILRHDLGPEAQRVLDAKDRARRKIVTAFDTHADAGPVKAAAGAKGGVVVALFADGTASVDGVKVQSDENVTPILMRRGTDAGPHPPAFINVAPNVPYARVIDMMDRAMRAGLEPAMGVERDE